MTAHLAELGLGERATLEEHRGRDGELADVVEQGAEPEDRHTLLVEPDPTGHCLREHGYPRRVAPGVGVTSFDCSRQSREAPHRLRVFKAVASIPPGK